VTLSSWRNASKTFHRRSATFRTQCGNLGKRLIAHFKLDERQLELVGELRGLLPATHAVTRVRRRKAA